MVFGQRLNNCARRHWRSFAPDIEKCLRRSRDRNTANISFLRSGNRPRSQFYFIFSTGYHEIGTLAEAVRRLSAILLLVIFGCSPICPALAASNPDSRLPPCCRRNGRHHCATMTSAEAAPGPGLQGPRCPSFPAAKIVPGSRVVHPAPTAATVLNVPVRVPAVRTQIKSRYRSSSSRVRPTRGPPALNS